MTSCQSPDTLCEDRNWALRCNPRATPAGAKPLTPRQEFDALAIPVPTLRVKDLTLVGCLAQAVKWLTVRGQPPLRRMKMTIRPLCQILRKVGALMGLLWTGAEGGVGEGLDQAGTRPTPASVLEARAAVDLFDRARDASAVLGAEGVPAMDFDFGMVVLTRQDGPGRAIGGGRHGWARFGEIAPPRAVPGQSGPSRHGADGSASGR